MVTALIGSGEKKGGNGNSNLRKSCLGNLERGENSGGQKRTGDGKKEAMVFRDVFEEKRESQGQKASPTFVVQGGGRVW